MKARKWKVDYSVKFKDGTIKEEYQIIEACIYTEAAAKAFALIEQPARMVEAIQDIVIWDIGMMTRTTDPAEVFEEAENNGI